MNDYPLYMKHKTFTCPSLYYVHIITISLGNYKNVSFPLRNACIIKFFQTYIIYYFPLQEIHAWFFICVTIDILCAFFVHFRTLM